MPKNQLEPAYQAPFDAWQLDPSKANTGALLKAVDPVINTALRSYGGPSAKSVTLKSQAKQLTVNAMRSYDPQRGPLKAHMMSRLQRLRRVAAKQRQIISVPEQVSLDQMRTEAAAKELEEKLYRPPSDQELADYTGLSQKRLEYIRGGRRPTAESTITRQSVEGGGAFDPRVQPIEEDHSEWLELVYTDLDETNQFIMERVLGMHGHKPQKPSAVATMLSVSPAAVSHRMAQIQRKLDQRETLGMF